MNRKETSRILQLIAAAYPQTFNITDKEQLSVQMEIWRSCFADESYQDVAQALKYHISTDTSGFPPVIGRLKEAVYKMHCQTLEPSEAWNLVKLALKNSIYNSKREFSKLPKDIQSCVGSADALKNWAMNDTNTVDTVIASNFQKNYRSKAQKHKELDMLPSSVKNGITHKPITNLLNDRRIGE